MRKLAICVLVTLAFNVLIVGAIALVIWVKIRNRDETGVLSKVHDVWKLAHDVSSGRILAHSYRDEARSLDMDLLGSMLFGPDISLALANGSLAIPVSETDQLALLRENQRSGRGPPGPPPTCATDCQCSTGGFKAYGRYCGYMYSGCEGYPPCDPTDACCMAHDQCVSEERYVDCGCTTALAKCLACVYYACVSGEIGFRSFIPDYEEGGGTDWTCVFSREVVAKLLADILYVLPSCFDRAQREALSAAVDLNCER
jgi:hypothetical protein